MEATAAAAVAAAAAAAAAVKAAAEVAEAAVAAEAAVVAAAKAAEHLLQTLLRARETHARAHTAWQGEPVGEDSGETPSLGVAARREGSLDASRSVMAEGQSRRMERSLLSGLGPRPARFECRRRGGAERRAKLGFA